MASCRVESGKWQDYLETMESEWVHFVKSDQNRRRSERHRCTHGLEPAGRKTEARALDRQARDHVNEDDFEECLVRAFRRPDKEAAAEILSNSKARRKSLASRDVRTHSDGFTMEGLRNYRGDPRGDEMYS